MLLGGILKGQELINNAKVRAIADRQNSLKVAWFAFVDRFAALPGDYVQAAIYISGAANGNGDGLLESEDSPIAFQHLTSAGYLRCPQCIETAVIAPSAGNSLINNYGGVMSIWHDSIFSAEKGTAILVNSTGKLQIHTGLRTPSNIMAEVDRKIDDGVPNSGDFRANVFDGATNSGDNESLSECIKMDSSGLVQGNLVSPNLMYWRPAMTSPPVYYNCGGAVNI